MGFLNDFANAYVGIYSLGQAGAHQPGPGLDPNSLDPKYQQFSQQYGMNNALVRQKRDQELANYGPVGAMGPSANYQPPEEIAPDVQLQHEKAVQQYNTGLAQQGTGYLRQGMDLFQSYRPGGAASLASGQYQGLANSVLQGRVQPLDLLFNYRRDQAAAAAHRQANAGLVQGAGTLIGGAIGAVAGGGVGAAAGAGIGNAAGGLLGNAAYGGQGAGALTTPLPSGGVPQGQGGYTVSGQSGTVPTAQAQFGPSGTTPGQIQQDAAAWGATPQGAGGYQGGAGYQQGPGGAPATMGATMDSGGGGGGGAASRPSSGPSGSGAGMQANPQYGGTAMGGGGQMSMTTGGVTDSLASHGVNPAALYAADYTENRLGYAHYMHARLDMIAMKDLQFQEAS